MIEPANYETNAVPPSYFCAECKCTDCKLWREYNTFSPQLLCAHCAEKDQGKTIANISAGGRVLLEGEDEAFRSDQIGWYVPAVPTEDGDAYWGYCAVPDPGVKWWRGLPNHPV